MSRSEKDLEELIKSMGELTTLAIKPALVAMDYGTIERMAAVYYCPSCRKARGKEVPLNGKCDGCRASEMLGDICD